MGKIDPVKVNLPLLIAAILVPVAEHVPTLVTITGQGVDTFFKRRIATTVVQVFA